MSKRINLSLPDEIEEKLELLCQRYNLNRTQVIRKLILDETIQEPFEIKNKGLIEKLSDISNFVKALAIKDTLDNKDKILLIDKINSLSNLIRD